MTKACNINITETNPMLPEADKKAAAVEKIANNLDLDALEILARKSAKKGMSDKVRKFKNLM